jgi:hypothetical protein
MLLLFNLEHLRVQKSLTHSGATKMKFNSYIWELYKTSERGLKTIQYYRNLNSKKYLAEKENEDIYTVKIQDKYQHEYDQQKYTYHIVELVKKFATQKKIESKIEADRFFNQIVKEGVPIFQKNKKGEEENLVDFGGDDYEYEIYSTIEFISFGLFFAYPSYFFPYTFAKKFNIFQEICEEFEIPIPPIPKENDKKARALYYLFINDALLEFGLRYKLSTYEICAFLYDFAPNVLLNKEKDLPVPSKVWLLVANPQTDFELIDNAKVDTTSIWGGSAATLQGDILLMYEPSPRKYIKSVWRANTDGFIDPFFWWYRRISISNPISFMPVTLAEMKKHPVLSQKGIINKSMLRRSGVSFTVEEYNAILEILKSKGENITKLPKIDSVNLPFPIAKLVDERSIEKYLVEPFLKKLGFSEKDWLRQFPVRMGRGERIYPDYGFGAKTKKGEETAKMILETKFTLSTNRMRIEAFFQAKSYALRLQVKIMILAAKEGIWIFPLNFEFEKDIHYTWSELNNPDIFRKVVSLISKKAIW